MADQTYDQWQFPDPPGNYPAPASFVLRKLGDYLKTDDLAAKETDPTVPSWAKAATKPTYTASEVGTYTTSEIDSKISAATPSDYATVKANASTALSTANANTKTLDTKANTSDLAAYLKTDDLASKETDPKWAAWRKGVNVSLGKGASAPDQDADTGVSLTLQAAVGINSKTKASMSSAFGYNAYSFVERSVAFAVEPSGFYLNSQNTSLNPGSTARSLQSYLDERATTSALADVEEKITSAIKASVSDDGETLVIETI